MSAANTCGAEGIERFTNADGGHLKWHADSEHDSPETDPREMTRAELKACVLHDTDLTTRRLALELLGVARFIEGLELDPAERLTTLQRLRIEFPRLSRQHDLPRLVRAA